MMLSPIRSSQRKGFSNSEVYLTSLRPVIFNWILSSQKKKCENSTCHTMIVNENKKNLSEPLCAVIWHSVKWRGDQAGHIPNKKGISASTVQFPANSDFKNIKPINTYQSKCFVDQNIILKRKRTRVSRKREQKYAGQHNISTISPFYFFFRFLRD